MTECIACGGREARVLYQINGFDVARCRCGLARTHVPADFDPASIYSEAYFQGGQQDGYADYANSAENLRREFRGLVDVLAARASGGRLIEVGSAYGFFLDQASARFSACGVEISDAARAACLERGHDIVRELTPDFVSSRGPFDAAAMLDVIEHLADPGQALALLHAGLRPGAPLLITTGDFDSWLARAMGRWWRLMTPPQHLWFFSPATLGALLARHGFRVEVVTHPWKHVPLKLIAFQAARYVGQSALVNKLPIRGGIPVNLFDAMRVVAVRR